MKTRGFFLWMGCILCLSVYGQKSFDTDVINRSLQDFASKMQLFGAPAGTKARGIEGSEYLDENFTNGEIFTVNSEHFSDIPMRYNAYYDDIEVKLPDGRIYKINDRAQIFQIKLNGNFMICTRYNSPDGEQEGFLSVLHEGRCSLYRKYSKIFREKVPSNGIINEVPAKFVDRPKEHYVGQKDLMPQVFNSKRELILLLPDHAPEIEAYFKKEKIRMNNEEDLIRLFTYYNSL